MGMIGDLKEGSYTEMTRRAEDRDKWRRAWMPGRELIMYIFILYT
jgi:hypothetical protein